MPISVVVVAPLCSSLCALEGTLEGSNDDGGGGGSDNCGTSELGLGTSVSLAA